MRRGTPNGSRSQSLPTSTYTLPTPKGFPFLLQASVLSLWTCLPSTLHFNPACHILLHPSIGPSSPLPTSTKPSPPSPSSVPLPSTSSFGSLERTPPPYLDLRRRQAVSFFNVPPLFLNLHHQLTLTTCAFLYHIYPSILFTFLYHIRFSILYTLPPPTIYPRYLSPSFLCMSYTIYPSYLAHHLSRHIILTTSLLFFPCSRRLCGP